MTGHLRPHILTVLLDSKRVGELEFTIAGAFLPGKHLNLNRHSQTETRENRYSEVKHSVNSEKPTKTQK